MNESKHNDSSLSSSVLSNGAGARCSGVSHASCEDEGTVNFREILETIIAGKWIIVGIILLAIIIAWLYVRTIPPYYKSEALIQVQGKTEDVNSAMQSLSNEVSWQSTSAKPSQVEAALIHSRFILEPTIKELGLNIYAAPYRLPVIGRFFADKDQKISVKQLEVPSYFWGQRFYLINEGEKNYKLYTRDDKFILEGTVGMLASTDDGNEVVPNLKILVSELHGQMGTKYVIVSLPVTSIISGFNSSLVITDIGQGKAGGGIEGNRSDTGILNLSLVGTDPVKIPKILDTILHYEVLKNTEKKSADIEKTLVFLTDQLPAVKRDLGIAETKLSNYRGKKGSLGMNVEGGALFGQMVAEEQKIEQAKLKKAELLQDFTEQHPYVISINNEIQKLINNLRVYEAKVKTLPKTEQDAINLERDVTTKSQLYSYMLGKIQQLQILKAGTVSDILVLGQATTSVVVPSKAKFIILAAAIFGFVIGLGFVFVRRFLSQGVRDPVVIENRLGIPVYSMIPHSRAQEQLTRAMQRKIPGAGPFVLAMKKPKDLAIENLRSLRTTLQFALQEGQGNIITILGGRPSIGKSFISLNLAKVIADSEQRVLLVDADLRRGKVNSYLMQKTSPGLSEVLQGKATFEGAKRILKPDNFHFLPAGVFPENPAELLFNGKLQRFVAEIVPKYDVIVIDTPPVLAVTDSFIIAKYAAINMFVIGAGLEPIGAIEHSIKKLRQNGIQVSGFVLNNTEQAKNAYGYGYGYGYGKYGYYYDYEGQKP